MKGRKTEGHQSKTSQKKTSDRQHRQAFFLAIGIWKKKFILASTGKDELFPLFTCTLAVVMWP